MASGSFLAFEAERWDGGTKTIGRIGVVSIAGVDPDRTGRVMESTGATAHVVLRGP